jgi:periplasmic protein TonB
MFDQTFVDGAGKTNKSWTVALSLIAEFAAIGMMILIPLIWTEVLPRAQFLNSLAAPAPAPAPVPPPPAQVARRVRITPRAFTQVLEAPYKIPQHVEMIVEDAPLAPAGIGDPASGVPGAAPAGMTSAFSGGKDIGIPPPSPLPSRTDATPKQEKPVPVGGNVQSAKLIKRPAPKYPAIAKTARIQGTVVLQAIIGKDGAVRNLTVISAASPLLVPSAMDAVKQWVYQPTLLNQEPVEVITEITVIFALQ